MTILGIDEITYGASDLDTSRRYFTDWGLRLVEDTAARLVFESLNGCRVLVADPARVTLPAAIEDGPTLREVVWGVRDAASLAALRERLAGQPGFVDEAARVGCTDPTSTGVARSYTVPRWLRRAR